MIERERLGLNDESEMRVAVDEIGGRTILTVDNFYKDPDYVRELALDLDFVDDSQAFYPGFRAMCSVRAEPVCDLVNRLLSRHAPDRTKRLRLSGDHLCYVFAVMTTPGHALNPLQCQPHYDSTREYAGLVYLNPPEQCRGGTSFWRHRELDLVAAPEPGRMLELIRAMGGTVEGLDDSEHSIYDQFLLGLMMKHMTRFSGEFMTSSNEVWELCHLLEMRYNRFVFYDAKLFHSAHVMGGEFGETPSTRRLTQHVFFDAAG